MTERKTFAKYNDLGAVFIVGVKRRDMTREEWERVPSAARDLALAVGMFELVEASSKKSTKKSQRDLSEARAIIEGGEDNDK